ncbi:hypothetical protein MPF94_04885 [Helicobacter pylori]|uniref:hypothetical protein n=1 Tax=Helicobacter pylori TaxID=210 RepID=UPI001FD2D125|nr:hypothetical protein [Helicobacter pylori]UOR37139.1 hypothetical protein MPF94_04125 [Helicobacter pylori]UOR37281.1 hypothetical protein MPF94_04885 [Helicobacter pylori]
MQLFEKWQLAQEAYNSFYEEAEHLGLEVVTFLKKFFEEEKCACIYKAVLNHPSRNPKHL